MTEKKTKGGKREGSGRKPYLEQPTIQVNARVPQDVRDLIREKGYTIREAIEWAAERMPVKTKPKEGE